MKAQKKETWFVKKLRELGACGSALHYAQSCRTFPQAWNECDQVAWLEWLLYKVKLNPSHENPPSSCPACKWEKKNRTPAIIRRRYSASRVAAALRKFEPENS